MKIPFHPKFFILFLILIGQQEGIHAKLIETFSANNGQKPLANGKMCLELFPDYVRHCARKLSKMLLRKDKFCSDYSMDCLGVGQRQKADFDGADAEGVGRERKEVTDNGGEVDANETTTTTTIPSSSTPIAMGNGTTGNGTVEEEPDELPPLDFSLRRPPPPPVPKFSQQYITHFCCRHQQRFECICSLHHTQIDQFGAAFCPTYAERCNVPLPDWRDRTRGTTTPRSVVVFSCKQIKLGC